MSSLSRRLDRLEHVYRPIDPAVSVQRAWLETLDDSDLEVLEVAVGHIEAGGNVDALSMEVRDRYLELIDAFSTFGEGYSQ